MQLVLSNKARKLLRLCEASGFRTPHDLLEAFSCSSACPAICMMEGCDHTTEVAPDQDDGLCEACGGHTVASARVLAGKR